MLPSRFLIVNELPTTTHGKVDINKLPEPDAETIHLSSEFIAPRNETEEQIAAVWKELLELERIGIRDNFFELGGHSLKATRVIFRLQRDAGLALQLMDIFRSPTIEGLAIKSSKRNTGEYISLEGAAEKYTSRRQEEEITPLTQEEMELLDA